MVLYLVLPFLARENRDFPFSHPSHFFLLLGVYIYIYLINSFNLPQLFLLYGSVNIYKVYMFLTDTS